MKFFKRKTKSENTPSEKVIVYGQSGYGKSYVVISKILIMSEKAVLVSANGDAHRELECMNLEGVDIPVVEPDEFTFYDKVALPKTGVPERQRIEFFNAMLDKIENSGFSNDETRTIIFSGFGGDCFQKGVVERISAWRCKVVIEYMGVAKWVEEHEIPDIMKSEEWEKYPLYNSLRPGSEQAVPGLYFVVVKDARKFQEGMYSICRGIVMEPRRLFGRDGFLVKIPDSVALTEAEQAAVFEKFMGMVSDSKDWKGDNIRSILSGGGYCFGICKL